jgi:hypothetical protein
MPLNLSFAAPKMRSKPSHLPFMNLAKVCELGQIQGLPFPRNPILSIPMEGAWFDQFRTAPTNFSQVSEITIPSKTRISFSGFKR